MAQLFTFDEPSHEYRLDGVRLPSVTQIIAPIRPDFSMVPPAALEAKRAFGTAVHLACELDDLGELEDDATDPRVMGCVQAWRSFKAATSAQIVLNEQRLYHPVMRFAGQVDRTAFLMNMAWRGADSTGAPWALDLKTSDQPHPSYGVQLAGYLMLLNGQPDEGVMPSNTRRATVHLFEDGTYRFHEYKDPSDEATFIACLTLHRFKEKHA